MDAIEIEGGRPLKGEVTVSGSKNATLPQIAAALLAPGPSIFHNTPALADVRMGARVEGAGTSVVTIEGVRELKPVEVDVVPDRIEAGTLLCAALVTGGDVLVKGALEDDLDAALGKFREAGATITSEPGGLRLKAPARPEAVDITTAPIPGFTADLQAQLM